MSACLDAGRASGLVHLKGLSGLKTLYLGGTQVTNSGLVHLKGLIKLQPPGNRTAPPTPFRMESLTYPVFAQPILCVQLAGPLRR